MEEKSSLYNWGITISCLGGLFTIFSLSNFKDTVWDLPLAAGGAILAFGGLIMINKGQKAKEKEESK